MGRSVAFSALKNCGCVIPGFPLGFLQFAWPGDPNRSEHMKSLEQETLKNQDYAPSSADVARPELSIFLPVFNEEPNLLPLHAKLDDALKELGRSAEIVYVDDGSTDGSLKILRAIAELDTRVRVVALRRNYGQ